jgi:hypothetical protein
MKIRLVDKRELSGLQVDRQPLGLVTYELPGTKSPADST